MSFPVPAPSSSTVADGGRAPTPATFVIYPRSDRSSASHASPSWYRDGLFSGV